MCGRLLLSGWTMVVLFAFFVLIGCSTSREITNIETVKQFRSLLKSGEIEAAHRFLVDDSRKWFDTRDGEGRPWKPGIGGGRWKGWDDHFRSSSTTIEWRSTDSAVIADVSEINDYYRLLERGSQIHQQTYFLTDNGRIKGMLISSNGSSSRGRTEEFLSWAREHDSSELDYLMPNGRIDPTGDRPVRFHTLLNHWREVIGLSSISAGLSTRLSD